MAKKRGRKPKKIKQAKHELYGILIAIISILGIGSFGPVGDFIQDFFAFLFGNFKNFHYVVLIGLFIFGIYIITKREVPNLLSSKLIGIYCVLIALVSLMALKYGTIDWLELGEVAIYNFTESVDLKGGMVGISLSYLFVKAFSTEGTIFLNGFLLFCGFVLLSGVSLAEAVKKLFEVIKKLFKPQKKKVVKEELNKNEQIKINLAEEEFEKNDKIVISSVDELKTTPKKEEKEEIKEKPSSNEKTYKLPPMSLLDNPKQNGNQTGEKEIKNKIKILEQVFKDFQIQGKIVAANIGPTVTQYELQLKPGTKVNKILSINKEIALSLAAKDVRIQAPIPGKGTIGIEIPNEAMQTVSMREVLEKVPEANDSKLLVALGKSISNDPVFAEINKTPHLLVAGATGSGKSVCINTIITSILMRTTPKEVKMIMVDPKKVELSMYNGIPHLLTPVVTDPLKAAQVLQKVVSEMEDRYDKFSKTHTKNIAGYNKYIESKNKKLPEEEKINKIPYIVVIVDELADLMLVASKDVEDSIMRITQMARAAGIHLIIATQRPSTDIITGIIKANIPSRISFAVSSSIDSRTILDATGAEKLLGKGDMLFQPMGEIAPVRIQGAYISEEEVTSIVNYTVAQQKAEYDESLTKTPENKGANFKDENEYEDPLYDEVVEFVIEQGKASASLIQRRFRVGYNRAARIIDLLENRGIVGEAKGSKPRDVLVMLEEKE